MHNWRRQHYQDDLFGSTTGESWPVVPSTGTASSARRAEPTELRRLRSSPVVPWNAFPNASDVTNQEESGASQPNRRASQPNLGSRVPLRASYVPWRYTSYSENGPDQILSRFHHNDPEKRDWKSEKTSSSPVSHNESTSFLSQSEGKQDSNTENLTLQSKLFEIDTQTLPDFSRVFHPTSLKGDSPIGLGILESKLNVEDRKAHV